MSINLRKAVLITPLSLFLLVSGPSFAASTKESIDMINQRLARIEQILQSQGLLDMLQQLESVQQELNRLQGEIEVQNHTLEQVNKRQRALYTDIDQRMQQLESGSTANLAAISPAPASEPADPNNPPLQTLAPAVTDTTGTDTQQPGSSLTVELVNNPPANVTTTKPAPVVAAITPTTPQTPAEETPAVSTAAEPAVETVQSNPIQARAEYQQAFKLLKQSLYDQAIKAFGEFLVTHPNSDYSDNAQYWLGEAYYVTRQFEQALLEYNKLVTNYPESQKLTHALLKIGYSYHELGQLDEARQRLEALKREHPGTTAARLADDRLSKITAAQQVNVAQ